MRNKLILTLWLLLAPFALAQAPQSQAPLYAANAKYTNGIAVGYYPTVSTGLVMNIGPGTPPYSCSTTPYSGGTLTMTASVANYISLNTTASCAPHVSTSTFASTDIPIAIVTPGASTISASGISDLRGALAMPSSSSGALTSFQGRSTAAAVLLAADVNGLSGVSVNTSGNAGTATALASAPTPCGSGEAANGVDVHGSATGCFTPSAGVSSIIPGTNVTCSTNISGSCTGAVTLNASGGGSTAVQVTGTQTISVPSGNLQYNGAGFNETDFINYTNIDASAQAFNWYQVNSDYATPLWLDPLMRLYGDRSNDTRLVLRNMSLGSGQGIDEMEFRATDQESGYGFSQVPAIFVALDNAFAMAAVNSWTSADGTHVNENLHPRLTLGWSQGGRSGAQPPFVGISPDDATTPAAILDFGNGTYGDKSATIKAASGLFTGLIQAAGLSQSSANSTGGSCAMTSSTSCTITLGNTYTTPVCIATVQSSTVIPGGCTVSGAIVTITATAPNSSTWGALIFGNPN